MPLGSEWVGVVGAILGAIVGGLGAHLADAVRAKRERRYSWTDRRIEKIEELARIVDEVRQNGRLRMQLHHLLGVDGPITREEMDQIVAIPTSLGPLHLVGNGYFPELKPYIQKTIDSVAKLTESFDAVVKTAGTTGEARKAAIERLHECDRSLSASCGELIAQLPLVVRNLERERA